MDIKTCACCHKGKSVDAFCKDRKTRDGLYCYCKECQAIKRRAITNEQWQRYQKKWRANNPDMVRDAGRRRYALNPEAHRARSKQWRDRHRNRLAPKWKDQRRSTTLKAYGLTPAEYDRLLVSQDGCCAICKSADSQHWSGRFQVDHDHDTNAVRGLLCSPCNGGLGMFKDSVDRLLAAMNYLVRTAQNAVAEFNQDAK